jgi:hypothetical protein
VPRQRYQLYLDESGRSGLLERVRITSGPDGWYWILDFRDKAFSFNLKGVSVGVRVWPGYHQRNCQAIPPMVKSLPARV